MTAQEFYENQGSWNNKIKDVEIWTSDEVKLMLIDFAKIKCDNLKEQYESNIKHKCSVAMQNQLLNVKEL